MSSDPIESRRTHSVALVAIIALALGLGVAFRQWRPVQERSAPRHEKPVAPPAADDTSDDVIRQALRQIPALTDSEAIKTRWTEDVKGLDLAALSPERGEVFLRFANSERCTCGCGYTLAACRAYDLTCPVSLPRVTSLFDSVRTGRISTASGLRVRPATSRTGGS